MPLVWSFLECLIDSVPMVESSIPGAELFTLSTLNALVTLSTELDYEVMQDYILHLNIKDLGSNKEGSLVLKVKLFSLMVLSLLLLVLHLIISILTS